MVENRTYVILLKETLTLAYIQTFYRHIFFKLGMNDGDHYALFFFYISLDDLDPHSQSQLYEK